MSVNEDGTRIVSYLPLAHITERVLVELAKLLFARHANTLRDRWRHSQRPCESGVNHLVYFLFPPLLDEISIGVLAKLPPKELSFSY